MSDISFKQAKEFIEKIELVELSLKDTLTNIDKASKNFEAGLEKQKKILHYVPIYDNKLMIMKLIVALNIGFILGLLTAKYIL